MFTPCRPNVTCINNNTSPYGYFCQCEEKHQRCKPNPCQNNGTENEQINIKFSVLFFFEALVMKHRITTHLYVNVLLIGKVFIAKEKSIIVSKLLVKTTASVDQSLAATSVNVSVIIIILVNIVKSFQRKYSSTNSSQNLLVILLSSLLLLLLYLYLLWIY